MTRWQITVKVQALVAPSDLPVSFEISLRINSIIFEVYNWKAMCSGQHLGARAPGLTSSELQDFPGKMSVSPDTILLDPPKLCNFV